MNKQTRDNLVVRLLEEKIKLKSLVDRRLEEGRSVKELNINEYYLNTGYITKQQYVDLVVLYNLLQEQKDITNKDLKSILSKCPFAFAFLRKINHSYSDLISQLRTHGVTWIVINYCGHKRYKELCNPNKFKELQ